MAHLGWLANKAQASHCTHASARKGDGTQWELLLLKDYLCPLSSTCKGLHQRKLRDHYQ